MSATFKLLHIYTLGWPASELHKTRHLISLSTRLQKPHSNVKIYAVASKNKKKNTPRNLVSVWRKEMQVSPRTLLKPFLLIFQHPHIYILIYSMHNIFKYAYPHVGTRVYNIFTTA